QQRLCLAGVLAMEPDLVLLDEPCSMLDDESAAQVRGAVARTLGDRTLVVVEHRFAPWLDLVERVVVLEAGRVVFDGSVTQFLAARPPNLWLPGAPTPSPATVPSVLATPTSP